jgi:alkanesulfonate monooxygenase SsuD/methylene tetrahydromethanopterin reductase-like flavin-dependent oxidoreductase (luciferase family)
MLPNHAPLVIAEQFGTLESLYPAASTWAWAVRPAPIR